MHPVFFGLKRAHWSVVKISGRFLERPGLTPARFDMMRIIAMHPSGVAQQKIIQLLGVSAATVSRMLKALELLGMIVRKRMIHDARRRSVHITAVGEWSVELACHDMIERGGADLLARLGVGCRSDAHAKLATLRGYLCEMRKRYGDKAVFEHPWTLDEIVPYVFHTLVDGALSYSGRFASEGTTRICSLSA